GGFTGVDVFFVISGYLITGLILSNIAEGKFSIAHFYERRVRRILPALFFLLICASIAAYALLMLDAVREFGRSLFATMFFSFYSSAARAWELLLGGILAVGLIPALRHRMLANSLATIGVVLLAGSFLFLSGSLPFPGLKALYPTIGTALIIYSGAQNKTIISKILSTKPFVFTGLISYSLYLWHWTLMVFFKYYSLRQLSGWNVAA